MEYNPYRVTSYNGKYQRDLYNNEIISAVSIASILRYLKKSTISQLSLVLPLISHKKTLNFLSKKNTKVRSIEELIIKNPDTIVNFNDRYLSCLITSLNSVLLLKEMNIIQMDNKNIIYLENNEFDFTSEKLGTRLEKIISCSDKLAYILDDKIENLYLQLRVIL